MVDFNRFGVAVPFDSRTKSEEEIDDLVHIGDVGGIPNRHRLIGQKRGAQHW